jgi:hypothetical protein
MDLTELNMVALRSEIVNFVCSHLGCFHLLTGSAEVPLPGGPGPGS